MLKFRIVYWEYKIVMGYWSGIEWGVIPCLLKRFYQGVVFNYPAINKIDMRIDYLQIFK
jgi:hypothetical protein